jgi:hypothetical protein
MTRNAMSDAVLWLLRNAAERLFGEYAPDFVVGVVPTEYSAEAEIDRPWEQYDHQGELCYWGGLYDAAVAERWEACEAEYAAASASHEARIDRWIVEQLADLQATGMQRLVLACRNRHLPAELRRWAGRQHAAALRSTSPDAWVAVAFAVLTLRDAVEWEAAHDEQLTAREAEDARSTAAYADHRDDPYDGFTAEDL